MTTPTEAVTQKTAAHGALKSISWKLRLIIAAFLLPMFGFGLAAGFRLPLPTLPGINLSGGPAPEYVVFMAYRAESVTGSLWFSIALTILAFVCVVIVGLKECGYTLQQDIDRLVSGALGTTPRKPSASLEPADTL